MEYYNIQTYIEIYNGIITLVKSSRSNETIENWEKEFLNEQGFEDKQDYTNQLQNGHLKLEYHIINSVLYR